MTDPGSANEAGAATPDGAASEKLTWMGRDLESMTKEELIRALYTMARREKDANANFAAMVDMNRAARQARERLDRGVLYGSAKLAYDRIDAMLKPEGE